MSTTRQDRILFLQVGRAVVRAGFGVAFIAALLAPLLALSWQNQPFAGFMVDPMLVVADRIGENWPGQLAGMAFPQRVVRVGGYPITTAQDLTTAVTRFQVGERIPILTRTPAGVERLYPGIMLIRFSPGDMLSMFWLPYLIGAIYLGIGGWIYWLRGKTPAGQALAFFCIVTALTCMLLLDLVTTHQLTFLWSVTMAMVGSSLIGLAWSFPEEWSPTQIQPWLAFIPYLFSIVLGLWTAIAESYESAPWAYRTALTFSYRYAAVGIAVFIGVMIYRIYRGRTLTVRRQARLMIIGSALAFAPIGVWLAAPLFDVNLVFDAMLYLPSLLFFPLSVAVAILRLRLWEVDTFINRAFVYGVLTAILAGVFAALSSISQKMFVAVTGERSDAAIIMTTLIIAAVFTPLRAQVQQFVDRRFRGLPDDMRHLHTFGTQVESYVQMSDVVALTRQLLRETARALQAESGVLSLVIDGQMHVIHTYGPWRNR
ncbi:MAG: hypothetical protein WDZ49_00360, partial [Litorilinea sp.]